MFLSVLDSKGLITYANELGQQSPPGSLLAAMNVNCDQTGKITGRRGFEYYSNYQFPVANGFVNRLFNYANILFASYNNGEFAKDDGNGAWVPYSGFTMVPPTGETIRESAAGGNMYFTTSNGIYKLSGNNSNPPFLAGAPGALDTTVSVSGQINTGFLNAQSQCAYEVVWGYVDESNLLILGAPSFAVVASNTQSSGTLNNANTTLTITIPPQVRNSQTLGWFYQIYRTPNTGSLAVPPGNNFQLVEQGTPTATDYSNNYISVSDTLLDNFLGAFLYTATGQPNVGNPYNLPPMCSDIAYFNNMAFYANYATFQMAYLTLISVGSPNGIQVGDTITLTDSTSRTQYVYTAGSANNAATRTFAVYSAGTISVNIQITAQNLQTVINQDPNNSLFVCQYISSYSATPGQLQLIAQNYSQAYFSITSSRGGAFAPTIPVSGDSYASSNVSVPNGLAISEIGMPESVPPSFILNVGSPNFPIERIKSVRNSLLVIKPEEGIYLITGTSPSTLTATLLDGTVYIKGKNNVDSLNNSIYLFSKQGVILANESGVEIMSRNIQADILALASINYPDFSSISFAVGYESENAYILFLAQNSTDSYSTLQYRYNWITQGWTQWDMEATAAIVNTADDRLYLATPDGYILQERKTFTNSDYADMTIAINITAINSSALTLTLSSATNVSVGDVVIQINSGITSQASVLDVDEITNVVTVDTVLGFIVGSASDIQSIGYSVTFSPVTAGFPAFIKKFTTWNFIFSAISFTQATISFNTDFYPSKETVLLLPIYSNSWGSFGWGTVQWGVTNPSIVPVSVYSTKNTAIAHWVIPTISVQQVYSGFSLDGFSVFFNFFGERSR